MIIYSLKTNSFPYQTIGYRISLRSEYTRAGKHGEHYSTFHQNVIKAFQNHAIAWQWDTPTTLNNAIDNYDFWKVNSLFFTNGIVPNIYESFQNWTSLSITVGP